MSRKIKTTKKKNCVIMPVRIMPPHRIHLKLIKILLQDYQKVIIVIGSRFGMGTLRECISADDRLKMLLAMLTEAKVSKSRYEITCMSDYEDDNDWYQDLLYLCELYHTNVVATGNEWIIKIAEEKGGIIIENPLVPTRFECRATLVREAFLRKDYETLKKLVPLSVLQIMFADRIYEGIVAANEGKAECFVPGRQTVDVVFLVKDSKSQEVFVLLGRRDLAKKDFPGILAIPGGGIDDHEFAIDAAIRELREESGLEVSIVSNNLPSTVVTLDNVDTKELLTMKMVGLYSSTDEKLAGTQGGSSQVYTIFAEDDIEKYKQALSANSDLYDLAFYEVDNALRTGLAFQHGEMIEKAMYMAKAFPKIKVESVIPRKHTKVIAITGAPGTGKSILAANIYSVLKQLGITCEQTGEFAKDELYEEHLPVLIQDQLYIVAQQNRRVKRLLGKVDYIITDAPLLISAMHSAGEKEIEDVAYYSFDKTDNMILFLERNSDVPFEREGRTETPEKSDSMAVEMKRNLKNRGYDLISVNNIQSGICEVLKLIQQDKPELNLDQEIILPVVTVKDLIN